MMPTIEPLDASTYIRIDTKLYTSDMDVPVTERLTQEGVIRRPENPVKVTAKGRVRVVPKPGALVSDWIADQRNAR
jgi:hypothetical protein